MLPIRVGCLAAAPVRREWRMSAISIDRYRVVHRDGSSPLLGLLKIVTIPA